MAKTYSVDSPHHQTLQAAIMGLGEVVKEANETQRTVDQFLENMDIQLKFHSNAKVDEVSAACVLLLLTDRYAVSSVETPLQAQAAKGRAC